MSIFRNISTMRLFILISISLFLGLATCERIGFAFSGAGSRFAEEAAIMESLVTGDYLDGTPVRPVFVSGTSAGAICAIALGSILKTIDGKAEKNYTFDDLRSMIFSITMKDIAKFSIVGIFKNIALGFLLDTSPLKALIEREIAKMGIEYMGDLYIPCCISTVNQRNGKTLRVCSDNPRHKKLKIVDVLMASSAIPVAFMPRKIAGINATFIDGGAGADMLPVHTQLDHRVDKIFLITKQVEDMDNGGLFKKLFNIIASVLSAINILSEASYVQSIENSAYSPTPTYLYSPILSTPYSSFSFDKMKEQYTDTKEWLKNNAPICLTCRSEDFRKHMKYLKDKING